MTGLVAGAAAWAAAPGAGAEQEGAGEGHRSRAAVAKPDQADLDRSQIIGNRELPKVTYIVPWKKPGAGDLSGRPLVSVLDEALAPLDRDVFRRQVRYDAQARRPDARARGAGRAGQVKPRRPPHLFPSSSSESAMDPLSTVIKFFQDCGLFIYPSALIMALGVTIAIERFIFLSKARNQNRKVWAQVLPMLQKGQLRDVQSVDHAVRRRGRQDRQLRPDADAEPGPARGLRRRDGRGNDGDRAAPREAHALHRHLRQRHHAGRPARHHHRPDQGLHRGGQVNPAEKAQMLSASISIAMNNTAFALMVAIPFLLIHSFLQAKTSEIVDGLEAAKISFLNLVQRLKLEHAAGKGG